eukprot:UN27370
MCEMKQCDYAYIEATNKICDGRGDNWGRKGLTTDGITMRTCKQMCEDEPECMYFFFAPYSGKCRLWKTCDETMEGWAYGDLYSCVPRDDNIDIDLQRWNIPFARGCEGDCA